MSQRQQQNTAIMEAVFSTLSVPKCYKQDQLAKFTDWELFRRLASELISRTIQINSGEEVDKAARDFTAYIASAYRLLTRKITLSDLNNELPGLESLLEHKRILRKLWQVTRDPAC
jgi:hypothetical protein